MAAEDYCAAMYPAAYPYPEEGYEYRQPSGGYRPDYYEPRWAPADPAPVYAGQWWWRPPPPAPEARRAGLDLSHDEDKARINRQNRVQFEWHFALPSTDDGTIRD